MFDWLVSNLGTIIITVVLAVIVAVPLPMGVTTPFELTVATFLLLVDHLTLWLLAFEGLTVALRVYVLPTSRVPEVLLSLTDLTG